MTTEIENDNKAHLVFKIYLQMSEICCLNHQTHAITAKQFAARQRIIADAILSIVNDPGTQGEHLSKMQQDFADKDIKNIFVPSTLLDNKSISVVDVGYKTCTKNIKQINYTEIVFTVTYVTNENGNRKTALVHASVPQDLFLQLSTVTSRGTVARLACYYTMLGMQTGQFWGLPPTFLKSINSKWGSALECFASAFNHVLPSFCSLMAPYEHAYGSIGDFFSIFPNDKTFTTYAINPPFVLPIMLRTFSCVINKLSATRDVTIIMYLPNWQDVMEPFLEKLNAISDNVQVVKLPKGQSLVYDYVQQRSMVAQFDCLLIMADSFSADKLSGDNNAIFWSELVPQLRTGA